MLRKFIINDEYHKTYWGYLFYDDVKNEYNIKLRDNISLIKCPIFFDAFLKRGQKDLGTEASLRWVKSRVVPQDRQGIEDTLKGVGLKEYDLFKLLCYFKGRCDKDNCYIEEISD